MSESPENMEIEISPPPKEQDHHDDDTTPVSDEEADDEDEENDADQSESMIDTVPASPRQRSRKTVERIGMSPEVKVSKKFRPTPASGAGMKLGEISKIADKLYKVAVKDDALKRLHRILYGSDGTATGRKKEIRLWNGTRDDAVKASMMTGLSGAKSVQMLKDICGYLSLATGGDRASLETRIFEFLVHPTGSTDPVKKTKKRKSKKSEKKKTTREQSSSSGFSAFLKTRMPEVMTQAAGSMSAQNITELLTFEWKNMSESDRNSFGQTSRSTKSVDRVQKVIAKSPKSEVESDEDSDNSSSDSSSSGSSGSSDSSSSSSSDESP